jgi:hypothetical protein
MDARQLREFYEDRCEGLLYALEILKEQAGGSLPEDCSKGIAASRVWQWILLYKWNGRIKGHAADDKPQLKVFLLI